MKNSLKKAQKGDESAFLQIFSMYEAEMYRIAFLYVKNEYDALDVIQEVAYCSFKGIKSLKKAEYFKTWLTRITINCAIDFIRKNRKEIQLEQEYLENKKSESITEEYEKTVLLNITLKDLMNVLDVQEKTVIILKYYYEHSFQEISEILKQPLGTVKTILYRALKKLRVKAEEVDFNERID